LETCPTMRRLDEGIHRDNPYEAAFEEYCRKPMRLRSRSWGTVFLPAAVFREVVRPVGEFTRGAAAEVVCPF